MKIILFCLIFISVFTLVYFRSKNRNYLRTNGQITIGIVDRVYSSSKGGINIDYHFYIGNDTMQGSEFYFISSKFVDLFKSRTFPVKYVPANPSHNRMLILKSNFEEMNERFPDSLQWILSLKSL